MTRLISSQLYLKGDNMELNKIQKRQVQKQLQYHNHDDYLTDIRLTDGEILKDFKIKKNVYRSDIMTCGIAKARWLLFNNGLYKNKTVIDMGCGAGILGIVCALHGADKVILSDISKHATENSKENIQQYNLENKTEVYEGDLFENIKKKADVIIFNHPYFADEPQEEKIISKSMLGGENTFQRFLIDSKEYLKKDGIIITSYLKLAGPTNDPEIQAPKYGHHINECFKTNLKTGLQRGEWRIFTLTPKE